jgi:hypothetical protein
MLRENLRAMREGTDDQSAIASNAGIQATQKRHAVSIIARALNGRHCDFVATMPLRLLIEFHHAP